MARAFLKIHGYASSLNIGKEGVKGNKILHSYLKLVGFARLDESLDKLICVRKVNILINHPLDDEQPILSGDRGIWPLHEHGHQWLSCLLHKEKYQLQYDLVNFYSYNMHNKYS